MPRGTVNELKQLGIGRRVQMLRRAKGLSLEDLAQKLNLSKVLLAQIEEDVVPPTVATLLNISKILGVSIDHFFTDDESSGRIEVTRADSRLSVHQEYLPEGDRGRLTYNYESLAYRLAKKKMEPFYVEFGLEPHSGTALSHDGEEFLFVIEGEIDLEFGEDHIRLGPGDSVYYHAVVPHDIRAIGQGKAKTIIVLYPYAN
ncbi:MAG: cupin domain-containing protein [Candidatus Lernaella stagnicola]|nr:cupin domain-containing protein [Candidatus Lernaella stagnicola]